MSADVADRGLLATLLQLTRGAEVPTTSTAIAAAVGIPSQFTDLIERRLQAGRDRGLVDCDRHGHWHATAAGVAATAPTPTRPERHPAHVAAGPSAARNGSRRPDS